MSGLVDVLLFSGEGVKEYCDEERISLGPLVEAEGAESEKTSSDSS